MTEPYLNNSDHLAAEMAWLNRLLHRAVIDWRAQGGAATEIFKGLYISDQEIDQLIHVGSATAASRPLAEEAGAMRKEIDARVAASYEARIPLALPRLARLFALTSFETAVVLLALAPEVDLVYERFFAYLQDDLSRKRPTVDLALRLLCARPEQRIAALRAFSPHAALFRLAVLRRLDGSEIALPARHLVPDGLTTAFLLGTGGAGWDLGYCHWLWSLHTHRSLESLQLPEALRHNLFELVNNYARQPAQVPERLICHLHGPAGSGKKTLAAAICRAAGVTLLGADLRELIPRASNPEDGLRDVFRQAIFMQSAVYLEHFDSLCEQEKCAPLLASLARAIDEFSWLTFIGSTGPWKQGGPFGRHTFVSIELPRPSVVTRQALWAELASEAGVESSRVRWADVAARFRLTPGAMDAALQAAKSAAALRGTEAEITTEDLIRGCYGQSNQRLGSLARKLRLQRSWADLTLPRNAIDQLQEICAHVRHRRRVCEDWGFDGRIASSTGMCALFYGASGAGKTMAVEIVARELELEVYKIDLSTVVSKYIGETEKNLSRIFEEAESSNAILFFDEADALFGKRSEVKDAHDRYANIEVNYLLQRIEEFEGLVILASNLRKHIDEGFFRRMKFAVEFPMPDEAHRYRIWHQHFPAAAPIGADVDIGFLASRFPLAGGNIRNIVLNAAFLAASNGGEIRMEHLIRATRREYDKTGRVCTEAEFAPYQALLAEVHDQHA
jgi:ATP-dependent 26S proteasome regulatory subunit